MLSEKQKQVAWAAYVNGGALAMPSVYAAAEAVLALERQAEPRPRWISVETAMPTVADKEYWCWVVPGPGFEHSDGTFTRGYFAPYACIVRTYLLTKTNTVRFNCGALEEVTHWMDKPAPPQPKEEP